MATHDYILANASGAAFRTDLNNALAAIVSNNSNSSSPSTTYAYQWWADTTNGVLKIRNSANNAWIELLQLDGTLTLEDGSASTPALAFRDDLNTGIYSSADNKFNVATAGVERMELGATGTVFNEDGADVDFRIEGDTLPNLFYVNAGSDTVGINTSSPDELLDISGTTDPTIKLQSTGTGSSDDVILKLQIGGTSASSYIYFGDSGDNNAGQLRYQHSNDNFTFTANGSEAFRIDADGRILFGATGGNSASARAIFRGFAGDGGAGQGLIHLEVNKDRASCAAGEALGSIRFGCNNGQFGAQISASAESQWGSGDLPTFLRFSVCADSSSSLSEAFRIDSARRFLLGHTSDIGYGFRSQLVGTDGNTSAFAQVRFTNSASGPTFVMAKSRNGTPGSNTIVSSGDNLGDIQFRADDGVDYFAIAASINAEVDGTPGAGDMPGRLVFSTTADGAEAATERMRITQAGDVGIGDPNPDGKLHIGTGTNTDGTDLDIIIGGTSVNTRQARIRKKIQSTDRALEIYAATGSSNEDIRLFKDGSVESARFDTNGSFLMGTTDLSNITSGSAEAKGIDATDGLRLMSSRASTSAREHAVFHNPNGDVGDITTSSSSTTFNTSSDYRLKENEVLISDGITRLKTLKPYKFNWKKDPSTIVDGFFAHEVTTAVPEAIKGSKDEVDANNKPVYQKIDHSKLVPLLVAAVQELITKVETLESA